ncbi:MAG: hypothetical protein J1E16_11260 [Muribaculaceae bacterium]|nr:hypothetical protein [Muribaculaceae bacterium]
MEKQKFKDYKYFLDKILEFNKDKDLIELRGLYNQPSFFEILSKERSETTYSAFLKWLFNVRIDIIDSINPIMLFLDIIIKRANEQSEKLNKELIQGDFQKKILSREIKLRDINIETEKNVSILAQNGNIIPEQTRDEIIKKCEDRIDIFISGKYYEKKDENFKYLQIIIENKIDSKEGEGKKKKNEKNYINDYSDLYQTDKYYKATKCEDNSLIQLYVFLTSNKTPAKNENFINISYQDILDGIILPLLNSNSLPIREKNLLMEFKNELMFPNIDKIKDNEKSFIAISEELSQKMSDIWVRHSDLIINTVLTKVNPENVIEIDNKYYFLNQNQDKEVEKKLTEKIKENEFDQELPAGKRILKKLLEIGKTHNLVSWPSLEITQKEKELLKSFYEENNRFLWIIMSLIKKEDRDKIKGFFENIQHKRENTRYVIFQNNKIIKNNLSNRELVFSIVDLWIEKNKENLIDHNETKILEKLREKFPREINDYYKSGRLLKYLFYKYNKEGDYKFDGNNELYNSERPTNGWELYNTKKYDHFTINGNIKITMVRNWGLKSVDNFIKLISDKTKFPEFIDIEILKIDPSKN